MMVALLGHALVKMGDKSLHKELGRLFTGGFSDIAQSKSAYLRWRCGQQSSRDCPQIPIKLPLIKLYLHLISGQ